MKNIENSADNNNRKNSIIIIKPIKKIESLTDESLRAMYVLQSTLDINILIELFDHELKKMVSQDYLNYKNSIENINIDLGKIIKEKIIFNLKINNNSLGKFIIARNIKFSKWEINEIKHLMSVLVQPINNALHYRQAITNASIDPVTKLNNRTLFNKIINQEIDFAQRYDQKLLLMMLDLDNFKQINDNFGHNIGDILLSLIGQTLTKFMRRSDLVFRYGGDEFCIILRNSILDGANNLANRIKNNINEKEFDCNGIKIKISVSIGLAGFHHDDDCIKFVERADKLLYKAKKAGRNNVKTEAQ
jgi:diguanylate cyclase (GGDEF)-like protein